MNIKDLAIRGLLQKHGMIHLYETCPELINDLVQLGEELKDKPRTLGPATTSPVIPHDIWNRPIGHPFTPSKPPYQIGDFPDVTYCTTDNGVTDND